MRLLPIWNHATDIGDWPRRCHIIAHTCHQITHTCCLPNETACTVTALIMAVRVHGAGFLSVLWCRSHLGNPPVMLALTLELKPSIFSSFMSNKCVRRLEAEWLAVSDPCLLPSTLPTASHLACLIRRGCAVAYASSRPGRRRLVFERFLKEESYNTVFLHI